MRVLITGGAGFIGSAFVRLLVEERPQASIVVLDALTYAGNLENLEGLLDDRRVRFLRGSICDPDAVRDAIDGCEVVVNFAAESHVDRSIEDPGAFVETNVQGTRVLLGAAVAAGARFVQVSTDEVYGSLGPEGLFRETTPLDPSSPYAASKAAADLLVGAWVRTYGLDARITRCGNNYGPRQFPEKLIPLFITNAIEDKALPLYGDGENVRDWIHVDDHCRAILAVLESGRSGRVYNVSAGAERSNREIAARLLEILGKPWDLVRHVTDRLGHDRRYALSAERLRTELGWQPRIAFDDGIAATVGWYLANEGWWTRVRNREYLDYYERHYGDRLRASRTASEGDA